MRKVFDAADIKILSGVDAIRLRPAMYLGELNAQALNCMIEQSLCVALDQAQSGECTFVRIEVGSDQTVQVIDDGPGFPLHTNPETGHRQARLLTEISACRLAKIHTGVSEKYCTAGMVVTNALSQRFILNTDHRQGGRWVAAYERGKETVPLYQTENLRAQGTILTFQPDPEIFQGVRIDTQDLRWRVSEIQKTFPRCAISFLALNYGISNVRGP